MHSLRWLGWSAVVALAPALIAPSPSAAQSLEEEMAESERAAEQERSSTESSTTVARTVRSSHELTDDQAIYEERTGGREGSGVVSETDPRERPDTDYFLVGAFTRGVIVPTFIQALFVTYSPGARSTGEPVNMGAGGFFTWRRNGFGVTAEVWYLGFQTAGYYHGLSAADTEFEFIESNLGAVFGNFLFGWNIAVTDWFGFDIGFGLGFGGLVGDLYRTEAYRDPGTGTLAPCLGPGNPAGPYCDDSLELRSANGRLDGSRQMGGTYQRHRTGDPNIDSRNGPNPWYFGDGGVPPMFFWIDLPRIGLRFKPIRQVQIQINGGYNLYGFNFGGSLAYGF